VALLFALVLIVRASRLHRLREVACLYGFTRFEPAPVLRFRCESAQFLRISTSACVTENLCQRPAGGASATVIQRSLNLQAESRPAGCDCNPTQSLLCNSFSPSAQSPLSSTQLTSAGRTTLSASEPAPTC
jgi:hypothetical protein